MTIFIWGFGLVLYQFNKWWHLFIKHFGPSNWFSFLVKLTRLNQVWDGVWICSLWPRFTKKNSSSEYCPGHKNNNNCEDQSSDPLMLPRNLRFKIFPSPDNEVHLFPSIIISQFRGWQLGLNSFSRMYIFGMHPRQKQLGWSLQDFAPPPLSPVRRLLSKLLGWFSGVGVFTSVPD